MLNFLIAESYTNYFNVTTTRGIELVCLLCLCAAILISGIAVYFAKKDFFTKFVKISFYILLAFAVSIIISNVVLSIQDGTFKEMDCTGYIEEISNFGLTVFFTLLLIVILVAIPFIFDREKHADAHYQTKSIAYAGICIALSFGLSYIRLFKGPYGGSITVASLLPIALYSYMFGSKKGTVCGVIYGLLQFVQDPYFYHILQFLLDYLIPFGLVGACSGIFRNKFKPMLGFSLGLGLGIVFRFISHFISGAVFFGVWAPETFTSIWTYSFVYNISYVLPDGIIAIAAGLALLSSKLFLKQMQSVTQPTTKKVSVDNTL